MQNNLKAGVSAVSPHNDMNNIADEHSDPMAIDYVKKKLLKKQSESKQKSNYLNFTNPSNRISVQSESSIISPKKVESKYENVKEKTGSDLYSSSINNTNNVSNYSNTITANRQLNLTKNTSHGEEEKRNSMDNKAKSSKIASPRYDKVMKKFYDILNKKGEETKSVAAKSDKNGIYKITSKMNLTDSLFSSMKKPSQEKLPEKKTSTVAKSTVKTINTSVTSPGTNKNSRKASIERGVFKSSNNTSKDKPAVALNVNTTIASSVNSNYMTSQNSKTNIINTPKVEIKSLKSSEISTSQVAQPLSNEDFGTDSSKKSSKNIFNQSIKSTKNYVTNSQSFVNNLKILETGHKSGNKQSEMTANINILKKKTSIPVSVPLTCQTSKNHSKNTSKSTSRIDEKTEVMRKKIIDTQLKKMNINSTGPTAIIPKKHSTSTHSPVNSPFQFNKDLMNNYVKESKSPANKIMTKFATPSGLRTKEDTQNQILKQRPSISKQGLSAKDRKGSKTPREDERKERALDDNSHLGHILDNSTCSVKSTVRECNYYSREAEKITNYIKQYLQKHNDYPASSIKFYKFGRLLGRGAFGKVNMGLHSLAGRLVAIKSFNKNVFSSENSKQKIIHETNLMRSLRHNSIVKIYETIETSKYYLIVMEYVCGGDLLTFVRKRTKLNETTAKFIFRQIIEAIQYMHSQDIVHRDIKLDNILIDLSNNIKICDLGVSKQYKRGELMTEQCGTPAYIAPEILRNNGYEGFGVDIWSAGVVLYAMLSGIVPFNAHNIDDLHKVIIKGEYAPISNISQEAISLLSGIMQTDPLQRLTAEEILSHPWLANDDYTVKIRSKTNLFTTAEKILLSKSNIDYKTAAKEDLMENFTLKNLDTQQEAENQNVKTKSYILAPYNSSFRKDEVEDIICSDLLVENNAIKFCGKVKELNRNYELNNNGEIDNGILINPQIANNSHIDEQKGEAAAAKGESPSKVVSQPVTPMEYIKEGKLSEIPSPKDDSNRNKGKTIKEIFSITQANTLVLDDLVVKALEHLGYEKEYVLKSLSNNELNYATTTYYLLLGNSASE